MFDVTLRAIHPRQKYPFPWSVRRFFGIFPDCVLGAAPEIEPLDLEPDARFALVILGLTVWYLAPSLPVQGFFRSPESRVLRDTPVITVIACRNMWHNASETIKREIKRVGGLHIDNVVVTDQGPAWATFVTTPRWMFTGRNDAFGIFPAAGVAPETLAGIRRFGEAISRGAAGLVHRPPSPLLRGLGAVSVEQRYHCARADREVQLSPVGTADQGSRPFRTLAHGTDDGRLRCLSPVCNTHSRAAFHRRPHRALSPDAEVVPVPRSNG